MDSAVQVSAWPSHMNDDPLFGSVPAAITEEHPGRNRELAGQSSGQIMLRHFDELHPGHSATMSHRGKFTVTAGPGPLAHIDASKASCELCSTMARAVLCAPVVFVCTATWSRSIPAGSSTQKVDSGDDDEGGKVHPEIPWRFTPCRLVWLAACPGGSSTLASEASR
jgi:hypothetical protein